MSAHSGEYDVLIVGGGPAGIAAACAASQSGARVAVIDDNPSPGGQIWRGESRSEWLERLRVCRVARFADQRVIDEPAPGCLLTESESGAHEFRYRKIVLATGARERFLPFPGWTLPNVMGAGGLQALAKSGLPLDGRRVVVAGSGPLLLAVAAHLRQHGALIVAVAEQAPWSKLLRFGASLTTRPAKLIQAFTLKPGLPYLAGCWPVAAAGRERLEAVILRRGGRDRRVPCDYLASGFGLVPNLELAALLGCEIQNGFVAVDEWQRTSVDGVYAAGELMGIGGLDLALASGSIAGYHAAGEPDRARWSFDARARALRFKNAIDRAFALRDELRALAQPDTVVCRCEDVTLARLHDQPSWKSAKLQTRCGMGPCQGRVCGPAIEFLLGWQPDSVRPPIFPARLDTLTHESKKS